MAYYGPPGGLGGSAEYANTNACNSMGGSSVGGKSITPKPDQIDYSKIFVGGLSWSSTEESLQAYFEKFGPVVNVEIMKDRNTGNPRGFCFIVFTQDATVERIMQHGKHTVDEKIVDVKRAQARGAAPPSIHPPQPPSTVAAAALSNNSVANSTDQLQQQYGQFPAAVNSTPQVGVTINPVLTADQTINKLFVGGLHLAVDNEEMKRYFEQYGKVIDSIVMSDPVQKRSRGFGFITYEEGSDGAQKAMLAQPHSLRDKYVEIKYAQPKAPVPAGNTTGKEGTTFGEGYPNAAVTNYYKNSIINSGNIHSEFYGLANAYGRNGWKAGYGTLAFGKAGWNVVGWETFDVGNMPERTGFSFGMLNDEVWDEAGCTSEDTNNNKRQYEDPSQAIIGSKEYNYAHHTSKRPKTEEQ